MFNAEKVKNDCVKWIRKWFDQNGKNCNAIVGISGGKDSSIVAALCVEALGKDRVIGVLMPNGIQEDIDCAYELIKHLDIRYSKINIKQATKCILYSLEPTYGEGGFIRRFKDKDTDETDITDSVKVSEQTKINLPARIRMATLYAFSQSNNGRVANTCNLSEDWVGYATRYGDAAGDFSPLSNLTVTEILQIGEILNLPKNLIYKTPSDGLCGKTDEDNLGFTYDVLDKYIRTGEIEDKEIKEKIDLMHYKNLFKIQSMPCYLPDFLY